MSDPLLLILVVPGTRVYISYCLPLWLCGATINSRSHPARQAHAQELCHVCPTRKTLYLHLRSSKVVRVPVLRVPVLSGSRYPVDWRDGVLLAPRYLGDWLDSVLSATRYPEDWRDSVLSASRYPGDWRDWVISAPQAPCGLVGLSHFSPPGTLGTDSDWRVTQITGLVLVLWRSLQIVQIMEL